MNTPKSVTVVAIVLMALTVGNIAAANVVGTHQPALVQLGRLVFIGILAYFLAKGSGWARWSIVVLVGGATAASLFLIWHQSTQAVFSCATFQDVRYLVSIAVHAGVVFYLALSKRVAAECRSSNARVGAECAA
jgi:hypothetical protein